MKKSALSPLFERLSPPLKQAAVLASNYHGLRRNLLRGYVFRTLELLTPSVAVERDGVWYFVSTRDHHLSRLTFAYGHYEEDLLSRAIQLLAHLDKGRSPLTGKVFIDIGANIGTTVIPAVRTFGAHRAIAFEPAPENYRLLRCNLVANGIDDRVETHNVALSDSAGVQMLELSSQNWGDHRLRAGQADVAPTHKASVQVQATTLDEVLHSASVNLDTVGIAWMDTQGHEGHILSGAQRLLHSDVPVVCEYWPYGLRQSGGLELFHDLVSKHYDAYIDLRVTEVPSDIRLLPADEVGRLEGSYHGLTYTDLVLLKR